MKATPAQLESIRSDISDHCIEIEDMFKVPVKVTCIVRVPDNDNADVLVSSDTMEGIEAVLARTKAGTNVPVGRDSEGA